MSYRNQTAYPQTPTNVASDKLSIEAFVKAKLPPLPGSVMRISALLRDINVSPQTIANEIGYDPMLASKILRLANSPFFALQRSVTTLKSAVAAVGYKAIYDTIMVGMAADAFSREIRFSKTGRAIWTHSLAVALLSRELSQTLGMRGTEEAFTCGLLHDIGKILFLKVDAQKFALLEDKTDEKQMLEWEKEVYGFTHAHVGAVAVNSWGVPESVGYAILSHHAPAQARQSVFYAHLVNVADDLANSNGYGMRADACYDLANSESVKALRLSDEQLKAAWEKIQESLEEAIKTFD